MPKQNKFLRVNFATFMRNLLLLIALTLFSASASAQSKLILSGYIKDTVNGEVVRGCVISVEGNKTTAVSNDYGFYSISLNPGTYNISFSYNNFYTKVISVDLKENKTLNIEMKKQETEFSAGKVIGKKRDNMVEKTDMSTNNLNISQIKKIPAFLGEVDIVRSVQLLPGVSTVGEGATGFNVRGGSIDQNLILLDEAPVFNSSHLFGFFSVFNPDAVKDVKLIKGGIPAQYGGRLSSALDVRMKDGNSKKFEVNGGVGLIFSRLSIEGPIARKNEKMKNKSSFIIAARRSYIDVLAKPFLVNNESLKDAIFYFYDLTAKVNYIINSKNRIYLSGYVGRDAFGAPGAKFDWGNQTATFRWNHLFSSKTFMNLTTYFSKYDYRLGFGSDDNKFEWKSNIINYSIKPDFTIYMNGKNTLSFGGVSTYYIFNPGDAVSEDEGSVVQFGLPKKFALESAIYADNEQKLSSQLTIKYGLRVSNFQYLGKGTALVLERPEAAQRAIVKERIEYESLKSIASYTIPEPRISANYKFNKLSSMKLSYNRMSQYLHLISNTAASVPLDVWTPTTNNIKPQIGDQVALGYFQNIGNKIDYELSIEGYYKYLQNQIDYIDGAELLLNSSLEADLLNGKGRAYGLELYFKKNVGKLTGWISYTLAKSERKVEGISNDEWYRNRFDRRHNMNIVASYEINNKWTVSGNFVLGTGTPTNLPNTKYAFQGIQGIPQNASGLRNDVTIKPYHRLDLSATYIRKKTEKWESNWVFGIYNVYGRRNPFSYYSRNNPDNNLQTQLIRYSVIGSIIPSVSWNFKF